MAAGRLGAAGVAGVAAACLGEGGATYPRVASLGTGVR